MENLEFSTVCAVSMINGWVHEWRGEVWRSGLVEGNNPTGCSWRRATQQLSSKGLFELRHTGHRCCQCFWLETSHAHSSQMPAEKHCHTNRMKGGQGGVGRHTLNKKKCVTVTHRGYGVDVSFVCSVFGKCLLLSFLRYPRQQALGASWSPIIWNCFGSHNVLLD